MSLNIALQIDPPAGLNAPTDTSLLLGREAQKRGHRLYYLPPESVAQTHDGDITGTVVSLELFEPIADPFFALGKPERISLRELDVVLIRQDPPFDMGYISNLFMLEHLIEYGTLVLNHPATIRNNPEKLLPLRFPEYCPPTIITADTTVIYEFHKQHETIVIKPAYGYGGHGIVKIDADGKGLNNLLETHATNSREPLVVQSFLPDVMAEEKRIILIDGKLTGAIGRIPKEGSFIANLAAGGTAVVTELTERQRDIAYDVGKFAENSGLMLVGLDVIGDYLIEVNITSPTGMVQLKELTNSSPEVDFWNAVEEVVNMRDGLIPAATL